MSSGVCSHGYYRRACPALLISCRSPHFMLGATRTATPCKQETAARSFGSYGGASSEGLPLARVACAHRLNVNM